MNRGKSRLTPGCVLCLFRSLRTLNVDFMKEERLSLQIEIIRDYNKGLDQLRSRSIAVEAMECFGVAKFGGVMIFGAGGAASECSGGSNDFSGCGL